VDASTDPIPDLGNASGGNDVTASRSYHSQIAQFLQQGAAEHSFNRETFDACVFIGGLPPHPFVAPVAQRAAIAVAADSGWVHAQSLGVTPEAIVGDFDSITSTELDSARLASVHLVEYPSDKDMTDAEIALQYAAQKSPSSLLLVSGGGDRLDHILAVVHALADSSLTHIRICAIIGDTRLDIVSNAHPLTTSSDLNQIVSILPIGADVSGVTTTGLRWPLHDDQMTATQSRGVSNAVVETPFSVSVSYGSLAVIRPQYFPPMKEKTS
jgi:thiamine pyrophosphokinase